MADDAWVLFERRVELLEHGRMGIKVHQPRARHMKDWSGAY
jgi:hypothetical protein